MTSEVLARSDKMQRLREAARKRIIDRYEARQSLVRYRELFDGLIGYGRNEQWGAQLEQSASK